MQTLHWLSDWSSLWCSSRHSQGSQQANWDGGLISPVDNRFMFINGKKRKKNNNGKKCLCAFWLEHQEYIQRTCKLPLLMLHKDLPVIPIMVFSITGFSCVVWEYPISLNAIQKKCFLIKFLTSPYTLASSLFTHFKCVSAPYKN